MRSAHEQEFAAFFDDASPRLLSAAWLLTGEQHAAEDLAQEALARTYARWAKVRTGNPLAFARRVMANLHTDRWRKHRREVLTEDPPETSLVTDPQTVDLVRALRGLSPRERECVVLRHYLDLSEKQTAETLGIGVGSVKSYTMHGLRGLRAQLLEGEQTHV
ncbi:SigE family RNA polymerase sigma factor [Ornithinimicrobium humiphilum]|uniref:RNA polymerase sigma-70 factor (Sigma-E family) n=1 Tax=Ornithinimicrobium humiphilum TaxID=125288 RepID=A0A543KL00_9MICO|nr:SigE family RNA polymerase sigma factor [Ornithinimicrobium humiphilum]TQM95680.1 RNA polymerase sigma-70 factor (sigma-E family) [Ornithinimicrobium humiphilum]